MAKNGKKPTGVYLMTLSVKNIWKRSVTIVSLIIVASFEGHAMSGDCEQLVTKEFGLKKMKMI